MAATLRVSATTRRHAADLAAREGRSIGDVVADALDAYETAEFWRATQHALALHRDARAADPAWERATADGLDRD